MNSKKQTLMNAPDVIREKFCRFLTDKDLTNLIIAVGYKSEGIFYLRGIRDIFSHHMKILQRFTLHSWEPEINEKDIYYLMCERNFRSLNYIQEYGMFEFKQSCQVSTVTKGIGPEYLTHPIILKLCQMFKILIVIGKKYMYFIKDSEVISFLFDKKMNPDTKRIRLLLAQKQILRKNKDLPFHN